MMSNQINASVSKEIVLQDYQNASSSLSTSLFVLGGVTLVIHILQYKALVETMGITPEKIAYAIYLFIGISIILYKYLKVRKYEKQLDEFES